MAAPAIDPADIAAAKAAIANIFIAQPHNPGGGMKQQVSFSQHECDVLVSTVLNTLAARGYAIMKPKAV